jgi:N4-(beta-N-acetylglucosaminyl)-L-asparaginase
MDGETMQAAGVAAIRVSRAVAAARLVMEATTHSLLVGAAATEFAHSVGGKELFPRRHQKLENNVSDSKVEAWRENRCQPNFRKEKRGLVLEPDPKRSCGPYRRKTESSSSSSFSPSSSSSSSLSPSPPPPFPSRSSHDTIAVVAIDSLGKTAAAASSNGAAHKVPGRAGDAAVPGGGAYATELGGCGSTGDGDLHLRYWPCVRALASLEAGKGPREAAEDAVRRIAEREPQYVGALVVACARTGEIGAAAFGWRFSYTVARRGVEGGEPVVVEVEPLVVGGKDVVEKKKKK